MSWVAVAVAGAAVLGAVTSSQASKRAASAVEGSADKASAAQLEMYYQSREDLAPWREAGGRAVNTLEALMRRGPGYKSATRTARDPADIPEGTVPRYSALPREMSDFEGRLPGEMRWLPKGEGTWAERAGQAGGVNQLTRNDYLDTNWQRTQPWMGAGSGAIQSPRANLEYDPITEQYYDPARFSGNMYSPQGLIGTQPTAAQGETPRGYPGYVDTLGTASPGTTQEAPLGEWAEGWGDWADRYEESPYYNFLLERGTRGLERGAAARGRQLSGAENEALTAFGQNLGKTDYNQWLENWYRSLTPWQSLAGLGQGSAGQTASAAMAAGGQIGQNVLTGGQAQAAGIIGQTQPYINALNWGANQGANYAMLNSGGGNAPVDYSYRYSTPYSGASWNPNMVSYYGGL